MRTSMARENRAAPTTTAIPVKLEELSNLKEVPVSERQALFQQKLRGCSIVYSFQNENDHRDDFAKQVKRQTLLELVDYVSSSKGAFNEAVLSDLVNMVSANLFRALPPKDPMSDPEEDEPLLEPSWPHLQVVYEFLLRFAVSNEVNAKVAKKYITRSFVVQLLELFDSEDPRERDYLKTILHRIYGKFMALRVFIRKAINNVFFHFLYETRKHSGIGEILEILGSIINGFALPLKKEHLRFLHKTLLPLHKVNSCAIYFQQLEYCVTQFVEKDPQTTAVVVRELSHFWPHQSTSKQLMFLGEIEAICELTSDEDFQSILHDLFSLIAMCIGSVHFQVAERALFFWNNEHIVGHISEHREKVLPIVFPSLSEGKTHWSKSVSGLCDNVLSLFQDMDAALYNKCAAEYTESVEEKRTAKMLTERSWSQLQDDYETRGSISSRK